MRKSKGSDARNRTVSLAISDNEYEELCEAAKLNGRKPSSELYARFRTSFDVFGKTDVIEAAAHFESARHRLDLRRMVRQAAVDEGQGAAPIVINFNMRNALAIATQKHPTRRKRIPSIQAEMKGDDDSLKAGPSWKTIYFSEPPDPQLYDLTAAVGHLKFDTDIMLESKMSEALAIAPLCEWRDIAVLMDVYKKYRDAEFTALQEDQMELSTRRAYRVSRARDWIAEILEATIDYNLVQKWDEILNGVVAGEPVALDPIEQAGQARRLALRALEDVATPYSEFKARYEILWDWCLETNLSLDE